MKREFKRSGRFFVYVLECQDKTYYTGHTNNLENRIKQHNKGEGAKYLRGRLPVQLVYRKEYKHFKEAFLEELRIKKLKRQQKEQLIYGK